MSNGEMRQQERLLASRVSNTIQVRMILKEAWSKIGETEHWNAELVVQRSLQLFWFHLFDNYLLMVRMT